MAATITTVLSAGKQPLAPTFAHHITVLGDAAYVAGGYDLALATRFRGQTVVAVVAQAHGPTNPRHFTFVHATGKLVFLVFATGAEVAGASDQSGVTADVLVITK